MIPGRATPQATQARGRKVPFIPYNAFAGGLWVSPAGFGGYRVDAEVGLHRASLRKALIEGINLVDSSANYADGSSETLVGKVLSELAGEGRIPREEVVVVTKGGYLQGQNHDLSQARQAEGRPFPDLVEYETGLEHCIHPDFIDDQIGRSLSRLGLETVDVYLLHNPEYYLSYAAREGNNLEAARQEYYRRIKLAFEHLEKEAARGRIGSYGVSSNTFPRSSADPEFSSLERMVEIARQLSKSHRFGVLQFPMNLYERGGATEKNQSGNRSVLDFAAGAGLSVLINRPLNAISDGRLLRLANPAEATAPDPALVREQVAALQSMEQRFVEKFLGNLGLDDVEAKAASQLLSIGEFLDRYWHGLGDLAYWREVQTQILLPRFHRFNALLSARGELPPEATAWRLEYTAAIDAVVGAITAHYLAPAAEKARAAWKRAAAVDADWGRAPTLSQVALRALRSTRGVTSVLVGMRRPEYVDDVVAELSRPVSPKNRDAAWTALNGLP